MDLRSTLQYIVCEKKLIRRKITKLCYSENRHHVPPSHQNVQIDYWNIQMECSKIGLQTRKQK